jgi:hypothetical protein
MRPSRALLLLTLFLADSTLTLSIGHAAEVLPSVKIWDTLTTISPAASKPTKEIKTLLAKPVEVAGFTVVNEMDDNEISEFLLTQYPGNCIHVPPPPPNHMIHVVMQKGKTTPNFYGKRVIVHGTVQMGSRIDSSYEMTADDVKLLPL